VLVDLKPYMDDDTIGWKDAEPIREVLLDGAKIDGKQYGIPFNKSTEMLFYNADLLKEYGSSSIYGFKSTNISSCAAFHNQPGYACVIVGKSFGEVKVVRRRQNRRQTIRHSI
jgi:ABC-type glycerol-3-phosphate transport system substrate-binding protein